MKKTIKLFSLALSVFSSLSLFTACALPRDDANASSQTTAQVDSRFTRYENLSSEQIWDGVEDAKDVKITWKNFQGSTGLIIKDGNTAQYEQDGTVTYYDYENAIEYYPLENGTYTTREYNSDWDGLWFSECANPILVAQGLEILVDDDSYDSPVDGIYQVNSKTLGKLDPDGTADVEAYLKADGITYTFVCKKNGQTLTCTIEFGDFTVVLPSP